MAAESSDDSSVSGTQLQQNKTPVMFLQELCTKRAITPIYELLSSEGHTHEPLFIFKVIAGDYTAEGKGRSKMKARHNAAALILLQMFPVTGQSLIMSDQSNSKELDNRTSSSANYVGELQELSQRHLWPFPIYECTGEHGLPHEKDFICTVRLFNLSATGSGKSKKESKRNAAQNLLNSIENSLDTSFISIAHNNNDNKQSIEDLRKTLMTLKMECKIPTLSPKDSLEISYFYQGLKYCMGKTLASLQVLTLNMSTTNYCQMLQEIAQEQNFEIVYTDILHLTDAGQFQCIIELSRMPVAVCQGIGRSKDEAHAMAAHNALQYLKIMTRK